MLRAIISRLTELRDTPGSFVGHAARLLAVKADESGVEFVDPGSPSPHDLGGSHHGADTLASLNAKVSDATLDDASDPRDPTVHASDHEPGGSDAMTVDAAAGTGSLRTLGTGAQQAATGDHDHDADYAAVTHTHVESDITDLGSYPDATGAPSGKVAETDGADGWTLIDTPSGGGSAAPAYWRHFLTGG